MHVGAEGKGEQCRHVSARAVSNAGLRHLVRVRGDPLFARRRVRRDVPARGEVQARERELFEFDAVDEALAVVEYLVLAAAREPFGARTRRARARTFQLPVGASPNLAHVAAARVVTLSAIVGLTCAGRGAVWK
jgi:hypothetical protein